MRYEKDLKEKSLFQQLKEYSDSDYYPFHMPGHKRQPLGKKFVQMDFKVMAEQ